MNVHQRCRLNGHTAQGTAGRLSSPNGSATTQRISGWCAAAACTKAGMSSVICLPLRIKIYTCWNLGLIELLSHGLTHVHPYLDRKNGAITTVEAPSATHAAMASAILGRASSMCAVRTILRWEQALKINNLRTSACSRATIVD